MDEGFERLAGQLHAVKLLLLVAMDEVASLRASADAIPLSRAKESIVRAMEEEALRAMHQLKAQGRVVAAVAAGNCTEQISAAFMRSPPRQKA